MSSDRARRILQKMAPGTMSGQSRVATAPAWKQSATPGRVTEVEPIIPAHWESLGVIITFISFTNGRDFSQLDDRIYASRSYYKPHVSNPTPLPSALSRFTFPELVNIDGDQDASWVLPDSGYSMDAVAAKSASEVLVLERHLINHTYNIYSVDTTSGAKTLFASHTEGGAYWWRDDHTGGCNMVWNPITGTAFVTSWWELDPDDNHAAFWEVSGGSFTEIFHATTLSQHHLGKPTVDDIGAVWFAGSHLPSGSTVWTMRRYTASDGLTVVLNEGSGLDYSTAGSNGGLGWTDGRVMFRKDISDTNSWRTLLPDGTESALEFPWPGLHVPGPGTGASYVSSSRDEPVLVDYTYDTTPERILVKRYVPASE